jgi:hypothetical protein
MSSMQETHKGCPPWDYMQTSCTSLYFNVYSGGSSAPYSRVFLYISVKVVGINRNKMCLNANCTEVHIDHTCLMHFFCSDWSAIKVCFITTAVTLCYRTRH